MGAYPERVFVRHGIKVADPQGNFATAAGRRRWLAFNMRLVVMMRSDAVWLAAAPMNLRARTDAALAHLVKVFGAAHPHQAYRFAN